MSYRLSYEDEQAKVRRNMAAPVYVPPVHTTQPLTAGPTLHVPHISLAHYPELADYPVMWRAIRDAVRQRIPFTWI